MKLVFEENSKERSAFLIQAEMAVKFLVETINSVDKGRIVTMTREEAETMTSFADTFTDGEDPEENFLAGEVMRIVAGWTL